MYARPEISTIPLENLELKKSYYKNNYTDDLLLKDNLDIKITFFSDLNDIENTYYSLFKKQLDITNTLLHLLSTDS